MNQVTGIIEMVEKIAREAGYNSIFDLPLGSGIRVENDPYMPLWIGHYMPHVVEVGHTYHQNGDLCFDPLIMFFTGYREAQPDAPLTGSFKVGWVPIQYRQDSLGIDRWLATVAPNGNEITDWTPHWSRDVAGFVNGEWLRNLRDQGFWGKRAASMPGRKIIRHDA
jgi:hypothetical protein